MILNRENTKCKDLVSIEKLITSIKARIETVFLNVFEEFSNRDKNLHIMHIFRNTLNGVKFENRLVNIKEHSTIHKCIVEIYSCQNTIFILLSKAKVEKHLRIQA